MALMRELKNMSIADSSNHGGNEMDTDPGNWPPMHLRPVGLVRSEIKTPMLHAGEADIELGERLEKARETHKKVMNALCELIIFQQWEELLEGIEGFSHILVLYWPHLIDPERRNLRRVHPMGRKDLPRQGIFATCSPARPNPVLVSVVHLVERTGNVLKVKGLDAVDGSPILDIKPYVQPRCGVDGATVPAWMERLHRELETDVF
jgi:tRNA-Thr(GGU) m(6)t(6)A37 methyltransferase TsaA